MVGQHERKEIHLFPTAKNIYLNVYDLRKSFCPALGCIIAQRLQGMSSMVKIKTGFLMGQFYFQVFGEHAAIYPLQYKIFTHPRGYRKSSLYEKKVAWVFSPLFYDIKSDLKQRGDLKVSNYDVVCCGVAFPS